MSRPDDVRLITRVLLRNYRSIAACDVTLAPLTFLVGPNGSGKSNFLDALRFVADSLRTSLDHALRDRGGSIDIRHRFADDNIKISLEFQLPSGATGTYAFALGVLRHTSPVFREQCLIITPEGTEDFFDVAFGKVLASSLAAPPAAAQDRLYLVNVSGYPAFRPLYDALSTMGFYNPNPDVLREPQPTGDVLARDGGYLPSLVRALGEDRFFKDRFDEYLGQIVPGIIGVEANEVAHRESLMFRQQAAHGKTWETPAWNMSDGTLRATAILTALFQQNRAPSSFPLLVAVEEPETALHPAAVEILVDGLRNASEMRQVIVTSHSPDLLNDEEIMDCEILAVISVDGASSVGHLDEIGRRALRDQLYSAGELLRMDQLRPEPAKHSSEEDIFGPMTRYPSPKDT